MKERLSRGEESSIFERLCDGLAVGSEVFRAKVRDLAGDPPQQERDRFGRALFDLYIGTLFRHGLYNCDPHPGNYLFCSDGTLAALNYGYQNNTLAVELEIGEMAPHGNKRFVVTLRVRIPLGRLSYLPQEDMHRGRVRRWHRGHGRGVRRRRRQQRHRAERLPQGLRRAQLRRRG